MSRDDTFDFQDLFVLDMANNHQGQLDHGRRIVHEIGDVVKSAGARAALKFQFRQLDTFIHPSHQIDSELKYVQRFLSTALKRDEFKMLLDEVKSAGMYSMCTPFDEESVAVIDKMGFDLIKIASCSAKDWPLLEEIAGANKPIVASTGGLTIDDIDNLVSFLHHRGCDFAIMHCVAIYPTPDDRMNLAQIRALSERYPDVNIGWSTHEDPADTTPVQMAVAFGAQMFERHVGVPTDEIQLNAYSSTPAQVETWLAAHARARQLAGPSSRPSAAREETDSIDGLRRGVYARHPIASGDTIDRMDVFFAMPYEEGQLESGRWKPGIIARQPIETDGALTNREIDVPHDSEVQVLKSAIHEIKAMLNDGRIHLGNDFRVEYSHHYGIGQFRETGAVIIECINREYCKKLVVQLPYQKHPSHYHKRKEETFQVLYGVLYSKIDGRVRELLPGDTVLVQPGVWHSFWTEETGVIFEEVSTTHFDNDSTYEDPKINKLTREERKTQVDHWGRFQLPGRDVATDPAQ